MVHSRTTLHAIVAAAMLAACGSSSSDGSTSPGPSPTGAGGSSASAGAGNGDPGADCKAARACCVALSGDAETTCVKAANDAEFSSMDPVQACAAVLAMYKPSGTCVGAGGSSGAGGNGGSAGAIEQSTVCARYVDCQTALSPSTADTYAATYGPMGTCWSSTASDAMACTQQCETFLAMFHMSAPDKCPLCKSNQDCSGSTPTCDTTKGECVM